MEFPCRSLLCSAALCNAWNGRTSLGKVASAGCHCVYILSFLKAFQFFRSLGVHALQKSSSAARTPYDDLADSIGRDCYIDVAGWHLYLKDVKLPEGSGLTMAQGLAAQLGAQAQGQKQISGADVESMLKRVPVDLGKGKTTVSLERLMPSICVNDLKQIMEEYVGRL